MRISLIFVVVGLLGLAACKHLGFQVSSSGTLKAIVNGVIKGKNVHCEKSITLGQWDWEVMCKVSEDIDIKYRTQRLEGKQTRLEIVIDKKNGEERKVLAAPVLLVKKGKAARLRTIAVSADIDVQAEPE